MARVEANPTKRGRALLLLALFGLGLACLALPQAAESGVATAWVKRYNGPANGWDEAKAMALDSQGNVCITGWQQTSGTWSGTGLDYLTIKYSPKGKRLWACRYSGPGKEWAMNFDQSTAIAVDGQDNVYVTGWSEGHSSLGWVTVKYSPDGVRLWAARYNEGNTYRTTVSLSVDVHGNAYVTGTSLALGTGEDYATVKYSPDGKELWVRRYNGPDSQWDWASAIALDSQGNVYITGSSYGSFATIKYNPEGEEIWVRRYPGSYANAISVDGQGNIYVTGESVRQVFPKTGFHYSSILTIKYDPNGQLLWAHQYEERIDDVNYPAAMAVDTQGNVYVTGVTGYYDANYLTIKYSAEGQPLWSRLYNGPAGSYAAATAIALDARGSVYVTGLSHKDYLSYFNNDFLTIKYNPDGEEMWVRRYNGMNQNNNHARAIAVDGQGSVYVAGISNYSDWLTIKYIQTPRTGR